MLASITPLGERSRGTAWSTTFTAFAVAAVLAGAGLGAAAGALGLLLPGARDWRTGALIVLLALTLLLDTPRLHPWLPTSRRQVNENWLGRYRGWVYGVGFGGQLGLGVATIVTSAAIYAMPAVALLSRSPGAGAIIGGTFGTVRALSLLPARAARDQSSLASLHARFLALDGPVRRATSVGEALTLVAVIGWLA